jgi:hypothetical protein
VSLSIGDHSVCLFVQYLSLRPPRQFRHLPLLFYTMPRTSKNHPVQHKRKISPKLIRCTCCQQYLSYRQERRHWCKNHRAQIPNSPYIPRPRAARNLQTKARRRKSKKDHTEPSLSNSDGPQLAPENTVDEDFEMGKAPPSPPSPPSIPTTLNNADHNMTQSKELSSNVDDDEEGYGYVSLEDENLDEEFCIDDSAIDPDAYLWEEDHTGSQLWEAGVAEEIERELYDAGKS